MTERANDYGRGFPAVRLVTALAERNPNLRLVIQEEQSTITAHSKEGKAGHNYEMNDLIPLLEEKEEPLMVDLDKDVGIEDSSAGTNFGVTEGGPVLEPYVGMEFESEEAARKYYIEYARRVGFVVRIMQRRRSEVDGKTLARRLGCNKQGFSPCHKGAYGPNKKPRPSAREGCNATILVKMEKSGKWVVTRFVKDHNHPLVVTAHGFSTAGDKDKKIEELTLELQHQEQLCSVYREKLFTFMNSVEKQAEELSSKVEVIVDSVRKVESEVQKLSRHR